jgi:hypothetical protein
MPTTAPRSALAVIAVLVAVLWAVVAADAANDKTEAQKPGATGQKTEPPPASPGESRQAVTLADAVLQTLERNLDISISRHTKESRLTDIIFEQAKFDPTLSVNGQYNRFVTPLNRPILGFAGNQVAVGGEPATFDQNQTSLTVDLTQNLITGNRILQEGGGCGPGCGRHGPDLHRHGHQPWPGHRPRRDRGGHAAR